MSQAYGYRFEKLPPGARIPTRHPMPPETQDAETEAPELFEEIGLAHLSEALQAIANAAENRANAVDEYNSSTLSGAGSSASLSVQPQFEFMPEKIEAIIVTGPTGSITLQIGDRVWALSIPATGVLVIAPIAILLSRTDARVLTPATPGPYTLELMGIADRRFSI